MNIQRVHEDSELLADYRSLTDVALRRRLEPEHGLYMAESAKVLARALSAGHSPRSVMTAEKWLTDVERILGEHALDEVPVYVVPDDVAERVTGYTVHRGMLAAMNRPADRPVAELLADATERTGSAGQGDGEPRGARIVILEDLVDHTNVGAVFRSAAALGVDAVLVTPRCADPLYRRSVRVSMGTVFQVPWTRIDDWPGGLQELKDAGCVVAGMTLGEGAISLDELVAEDHENLALVFGSEGHGITPRTDRALDRRVTIPMMGGVDSLNVAAASAVAFYATRVRGS
ncbi:TrmH family RNA methyltransferase [Microbacterium sp. JB110]|uniref:TrmH family RNA methyltransferase n=1 Tax=Microbacterium sp. JB110 TaxID=2024477 RepID=UPI00097F3B59|nr:RNA methyltransferase [Microbacterium sp. JB110]RCS62256.1 RNA methyltransferase [Microbacterium sp. JB110]SJM44496.1 RRNA methylase family protein [Frigoribacterium sp. JB110]